MLLGAVAALCSAALWAAGSVIYTVAGRKITALELNLIKGVAAIAMLIATIMLLQRPLPGASWAVWLYLPLSGMAGIGLSDTFLLEGFKLIGPRRVLLIKTVTPPLTALVAMVTLGEYLEPTNWLGIILVAIGVAWVITERTAPNALPLVGRGIVLSLLAAAGEAIGALLARLAFLEADIEPLWAALIRLVSAVPIILIWMLRQRGSFWYPQASWPERRSLLGLMIVAAMGSTYLGIWLQQTAYKLAPVGIAQALTATSPLFILPLVGILGETVSLRAVLGVVIAIGGIALLFR